MSLTQNKAVIRRLFEEVYNAKNIELVDELTTPDYVDHNPTPGLDTGPAGLKQFIQVVAASFPDNRLTIDDMLAEGDRVAVRWTSHNIHTGTAFFGIPPSGNTAVFTGTTIYRLLNGRIAELWYNADALALFHQLGVPLPLG
jgi:predicted ester cyclase